MVPFLLILLFFHLPHSNAFIDGKYKVARLWIKDSAVDLSDCRDSVLTLVYLEKGAETVFEYNSQERRVFGRYSFDGLSGRLRIVWHSPVTVKDTLDASVSKIPRGLSLIGKMGNDPVKMELKKVR